MPTNPESLTQRIETLLAQANAKLAAEARRSVDEAEHQQQGFLLFSKLADDFLQTEAAPRLNKLAGYFPNAKVEVLDVAGVHGANCRFQHTIRFPATVELRICCAHDERVEQFICSYDVQILPVFIKFQKHDQIATPLEPFDRNALLPWLDDKIVQFLDTYLTIEFADQYQSENHVTDPVSQARLNRAIAAAQATYKGKTYFFLTDENRKLFEAAPERYVAP